jgi:hypothetical protein
MSGLGDKEVPFYSEKLNGKCQGLFLMVLAGANHSPTNALTHLRARFVAVYGHWLATGVAVKSPFDINGLNVFCPYETTSPE